MRPTSPRARARLPSRARGRETEPLNGLADEQVFQALAALRPWLPHHASAVQLEHVKRDEGEITADPVPLLEHGLDALVAVACQPFLALSIVGML